LKINIRLFFTWLWPVIFLWILNIKITAIAEVLIAYVLSSSIWKKGVYKQKFLPLSSPLDADLLTLLAKFSQKTCNLKYIAANRNYCWEGLEHELKL
jgi:hypothetical protein